jgi:hypothetical protein
MGSDEFKGIVQCEFYRDNIYVWKVYFDILKYEVSKSLKADFETLASRMDKPVSSMRLEYEVIFPEAYPH